MNARAQPRPSAHSGAPRLGFVGLGWIGRQRLDALAGLGGIEVAALCDAEPARRQAAAEAYPGAEAAGDLEELLATPLDGVVLATPSGLHAAQAIACLERGVAVFCQKPLALNASDARAVVDAAERADRLLGVDFSYRYVAGMDELRSRLARDELGRVLAIELAFHNAYAPDKAWCADAALAGGGCLLDLGIHLVDLALWLVPGLEPRVATASRFAAGRALRPGERAIEDLAYATLAGAGGEVVRLGCAWHAQTGADAVIELRLVATGGGAVWRNVDGSFYDFTLDLVRGTGRTRIAAPPDAWGPRALAAWAEGVARGGRYDPEARRFVAGAAVVDALYAA